MKVGDAVISFQEESFPICYESPRGISPNFSDRLAGRVISLITFVGHLITMFRHIYTALKIAALFLKTKLSTLDESEQRNLGFQIHTEKENLADFYSKMSCLFMGAFWDPQKSVEYRFSSSNQDESETLSV